jgi:hypothetical protein
VTGMIIACSSDSVVDDGTCFNPIMHVSAGI